MKGFSKIAFLLFLSLSIPLSVEANDKVEIQSETAIIMDSKSGKVLYEKKAHQQMYPASITKIITGIVALEQGNISDIVTVSSEATRVIGTRVYLLEGEDVTLEKLVQGMMINSGNDAGTAIAEHFDGSEEKFSNRMNDFITEVVGVKNSNFTNPHGLFGEEHYTTAYDMAKITQYAMKNEAFREIVGTKFLEWNGEGWETTLINHHRLLGNYEGVTGVKNGYVSMSGHTLVTSAERGDTELIVVTLNAPSAKIASRDTMTLLDYGFEHFETKTVDSGNYYDSFGNEYKLAEDLFVTTHKGETIEVNVSVYGYITVLGENNRLLSIKALQRKVPEKPQVMLEPKQETKSKEATNFFEHSILTWLGGKLGVMEK
ncbi:D-alanyl-D-alanine carboxypeptidase family protein [Bacillus alkalicellulosilyticus]|uniref:D-alanyl-D-alanine carboxypeptidase family protein n=1 Tax=Alkalihalobacterium alkalicellulosilyticum TaxID=1912214 RepID=UPI0009967C2E|nr:D-alanyl-D-alanine carboxypeptidase family protein [Bacillus alkalicellulosilyticus]